MLKPSIQELPMSLKKKSLCFLKMFQEEERCVVLRYNYLTFDSRGSCSPVDLKKNHSHNDVISSKQKIWEQQGTDIYFIRLELRFLTLMPLGTEKAHSPQRITSPPHLCVQNQHEVVFI